jgi:hypothetical protein
VRAAVPKASERLACWLLGAARSRMDVPGSR